MQRLDFTIRLTSDGEPGSGFGTEMIDNLLPRDANGNIFLPATHLKGIVRENLENMPNDAVPHEIVDVLFGKSGAQSALFHIENAATHDDVEVIDITRTKLNEFGTADDSSLRTCEAVACGTEFKGTMTFHPGVLDAYKDILRLGFLSILAVGGGRNRGAGACITTLENEQRTPGQILRQLAKLDFSSIPAEKAMNAPPIAVSERQVILQMVFRAADPVCVPEIPVIGNNLIRSGFSIPASAVQGMILHRINNISESVATSCFNSPNFRAWPLHPTDSAKVLPLRVAFTHKISKSKIQKTEEHYFADEIIKPYRWHEIPDGASLVPADGVLLKSKTCTKLWKASDMARLISAHGVHNGDRGKGENEQKRNLFVVESMAPVQFAGIVSMPETAADLLLKSLEKNPFVQFGKSRSVRGGGRLCAQIVSFDDLSLFKEHTNRCFIVQSPAMVPRELTGEPAGQIMAKLVSDAGLGTAETAKGAMTTQFGWNNSQTGRVRANAVISPGAVFKLKSPLQNLEKTLATGIGLGRENGFGAILPHPGIAQQLCVPAPAKRVEPRPPRNFGKDGFNLWREVKSSGLSASQVSRLCEIAALDPRKALAYLKRQETDRPAAVWNRWKGVIRRIEGGLKENPKHMVSVLRVCRDLRVADNT